MTPSVPTATAAAGSAPIPVPGTAFIPPPVKGSLQHTGHGDLKHEQTWGTPESVDRGRWRSGSEREKEGSNLQKMAGMSRSLESVLSGGRPKAHTVGMVRVDQHGKIIPPVMTARSVVTPQDPRRFSEASIIPPPRPPPPNFKRFLKPHKPSPSLMSRERERPRDRDRDKSPQIYSSKDTLISQVMEAVHGVTTEEVHTALQRCDWNSIRAEQHLKLEQLYSLSLCSREDCARILAKHQWNLQMASRYLLRWSRDDRTGPVSVIGLRSAWKDECEQWRLVLSLWMAKLRKETDLTALNRCRPHHCECTNGTMKM